VLHPERRLTFLTDREEKERLIRDIGLDEVTVFEFTREFSMLPAEEFINLLQARHPLRELWVGPDFALGMGRSGTISALAEIGRSARFALHMVPPQWIDGEAVSSTYIRSLLADGDVAHANRLLGRAFAVCGEVVHGDQRGRELGFPTANLRLPQLRAVPGDGVYVAGASWDGGEAAAIVNLGGRPTFGDDTRLLEAHLLDTSVDLYGRRLCLSFLKRLRGIKKFDSLDGLKAQLVLDREAAVRELSGG
jgi:riboflavin kinase/FMN adenylyltransferase